METEIHTRARWAVLLALIIGLPFMAGAIHIGWQAAVLPDAAGRVVLARLLGAGLFAFGFATALVSSVVSLVATRDDKRALAVAGLLLGCSHMVLGFVVRRTIEGAALNSSVSLAPTAIPVLLWAASIWLAVKSTRVSPKKEDSAPDDTPTEEQPPLLSQP